MAMSAKTRDFRNFVNERRKLMKDLCVPQALMVQLPWAIWQKATKDSQVDVMWAEVDTMTRRMTENWFEIVNKCLPEIWHVIGINTAEHLRLATNE